MDGRNKPPERALGAHSDPPDETLISAYLVPDSRFRCMKRCGPKTSFPNETISKNKHSEIGRKLRHYPKIRIKLVIRECRVDRLTSTVK